MTRSALLLTAIGLWGLVGCDNERRETSTSAPASSSSASVTLGGQKFDVTLLLTERDRRHAVSHLAAPGSARGYLLAWPRERFMKIESEGSRVGFDAVFLNASGGVVDLGPLPSGDVEGLEPHAPAAYALLLAEGSSAKLGLKPGDHATLSPEVLSAKPEELAVITINGIAAHVELALTEPERQHGLMFRPRMSADDGMLFAYPDEDHRNFWMGNTLIPLDIAFFSGNGILLNVNETPTYPDPRHPGDHYATSSSRGEARFVLEMNLGWFRKKGIVDGSGQIAPGTKGEIPPQAFQ